MGEGFDQINKVNGSVPKPAQMSADTIRQSLPPGTPPAIIAALEKLPPALQKKRLEAVGQALWAFGGDVDYAVRHVTPPEVTISDTGRVTMGKAKLEPISGKMTLAQTDGTKAVFRLLDNPDMAAAFIEDPLKYADYICRIIRTATDSGQRKDTDKIVTSIFTEISKPELAGRFAKNPHPFYSIVLYAKEGSDSAFRQLGVSPTLLKLFDASPMDFAVMARISSRSGMKVADAFALFIDPFYAKLLTEEPKIALGLVGCTPSDRTAAIEAMKKANNAMVVTSIAQYDKVAIEVGSALDEYHEETNERTKILGKLSLPEVIGLLCSNPELFYTSSNHLLFDRLKREIGANGGLGYLKDKYGLSDAELTNFVFRAINYGKLGDFISKDPKDIGLVASIVRGDPVRKSGIYMERFDPKYAYLMANGIASVGKYIPKIKEDIEKQLAILSNINPPTQDQKRVIATLKYLDYVLTDDTKADSKLAQIAAERKYDRARYMGKDKVLTVLQVFDREDTERGYWTESVARFTSRLGAPKKGASGELIFERGEQRVILFMGKDAAENRIFAKSWLAKNDSGIITFRGHSYHLRDNLPSDIFGNTAGRYVFIPGSCGSAGSVPEYISANPKTNLQFFGNTATSDGSITNAIVGLLLQQTNPVDFADILKLGAGDIRKAGGNPGNILVRSPGQLLLGYVYSS